MPIQIRSVLRPSSPAQGMWWRYNADGFLVYSADTVNGNCFSYVQLFHNGCLEYGDGYILNLGKDLGRENQIPSKTLEVDVVKRIRERP